MNDMNNGRLVIISGPSGAGKDTIVGKLLETDDSFSLSVSATTRKPRAGEIEGESYYFISDEEFSRRVENNEFIEFARYGSNRYGTLKSDVERRMEAGKTVVLVIEVQGAANIKRMYPDALSIFIMPPSFHVLEKRLRERCSEDESEIRKRLEIAKHEIEKRFDYDIIVENDVLEDAVEKVHSIILGDIVQ